MGEDKIIELEEELRVVANNLKSLAVSRLENFWDITCVLLRWLRRRPTRGRRRTRSRSRL